MVAMKMFLVLIVAIAQQHAFTPPNARPPSKELRELRGSEHAIPFVVVTATILIWSWAFLECSILFALSGYCPVGIAYPLLRAFFPITFASERSDFPTAFTTLTPTFLTGTFITLTSALLRAHCFYTLGPRFTFQLSIRRSHKLVTEGVYGIIRHPSYTALLAVVAGWLLCALDLQGPVMAMYMERAHSSDGDVMMTGVSTCAWAVVLGPLLLLVTKRMDKEDVMLEKHFGKEWRVWARRVPYRLVPGVY